MKLLLSQKNKLFDVIEKKELSPALFEYKETLLGLDVLDTTVRYKNSSFYFSMSSGRKKGYIGVVKCSPGRYDFENLYDVEYWVQIENAYEKWLDNLKREIQLEDKWEKFNNEIQSLQLYNNENDFINSKFTVPEYLEIKQKIFQLKEGISRLELLPQQTALLNDKLDMVLDMTTQLGRFDWKSLFVGTIVSIIIQLSVTQDNAKAIWDLIKRVFHNYFVGQ